MSIYGDLQTLECLIDDCFDPITGEIKPEDDAAYQELKAELTHNGLERCAKVRANKMARIAGLKSELDRIKSALTQDQKQLDWLENYMLLIYDHAEKDATGKVHAGTFTIGTRKSTSVCLDDDFYDARFQTEQVEIKVDKVALKKALLAGEYIPGTHLQNNLNLTVR